MREGAEYRRLAEEHINAGNTVDELVRTYNTKLGIEGDAANLLHVSL